MKPTLLTDPGKRDARGEGGRPVEGTPQRAAGGQSASTNYGGGDGRHQATKSCKVCGAMFAAFRPYYRKCRPCAQKFLEAQRDLAKQRCADGVVAYQLRQHAAQLRSDDPAVQAWLMSLVGAGV